jgi:hypothetical protein
MSVEDIIYLPTEIGDYYKNCKTFLKLVLRGNVPNSVKEHIEKELLEIIWS